MTAPEALLPAAHRDAPVLRAAIIGCGAMASDGWERDVRTVPGYLLLPYSHAGAYQRHPRTRLVAAADVNQERLETFGARWGVPALYRDHREMLERERLDLVSIVTSTAAHPALTIDVARAGARGIFLEKPVAETLANADAMIAACREAGVAVAVNHYRTFDPYYAAARALLRDGEIGELRGVKATWGEGFAQGGCHLLDLLRYLIGSPVSWVFCHLDDDRSLVDPGGDAYLVYENGVRAHVHMPWDVKAPSDLELVGTEGVIRMGAYDAQWWKLVRRGERSIPVEWPFPGRHQGHSGMYAALEQLIGAIEGGDPPSSTLEDGRAVLETTVALLKSGQSGQPVRLPVDDPTFAARSWL